MDHTELIKRIFTMVEGHLKDKFTDKEECATVNRLYDICIEHFKIKKAYPYTFKVLKKD